MLTISTGEVRVRLLLLSSEFHLDGINSSSEEMDGGDLARRVVGPSDVDGRMSCPSALVSTAVVVWGGGGGGGNQYHCFTCEVLVWMWRLELAK